MYSLAVQFFQASCYFPACRSGYSPGYPVLKYTIKKSVSIMTTDRLKTAPAPTSWRTCKSSAANTVKNVQHDRGIMNQVLSKAHTVQPQALDVMFSRDNGAGNEEQSASGGCNLCMNRDGHSTLLDPRNRWLNFLNTLCFQTAITTTAQLVEIK
jgi:hypothetical protein